MPPTDRSALARLESLRLEYGRPALAREKRGLLARLARTTLASAAEVLRLHELLVFLCAYPDDTGLRRRVERLLAAFPRRRDLRRHRAALAGSGIAGTDTPYRFFAETARVLAARWPAQLHYDWAEWDDPARLEELLPLLAVHGETPGLDEYDLGVRGWLARMKGPRLGDAAWATRRLAARCGGDAALFERLHDGIDAPMVLRSGPGTPERTTARWPVRVLSAQRKPLERGRPDLATVVRTAALHERRLPVPDGERLADLARVTMVSRQRDLDAFAYADPRDARLITCGAGLAFGVLGVRPERRLLLESVYGMLTLKNGVPIGYVLTSALHGSAEVAYNVFDANRGAEAAGVYAQVLAMTRHLFGADAFTVYPYQLGGAGNEEGLASGAWWFYRKLGFAPHDRGARAAMRREEARMARDPAHRSSRRVLRTLAAQNVYWFLDGHRRRDIVGELPLANLGLAVTDLVARRFADHPDRGEAACVAEATAALGGGPRRGWSAGERQAFARWAPLVLLLDARRWSAGERAALSAVIRAKGGRRESEFVRAYDAHPRLRAAIAALAHTTRA
jgi:hypothetical protein